VASTRSTNHLPQTPTRSFGKADINISFSINTSAWQLDRYSRWPRVDLVAWRESQGRQGTAGGRWPSRLNESRSELISRAPLGYPDWGFPWFSSVVRQTPGYSMQSRGTARTPLPQARRLHLSTWQTSHISSMRQSQCGLGTQTANQPKLIPPIFSPGQSRP